LIIAIWLLQQPFSASFPLTAVRAIMDDPPAAGGPIQN
jgi:hypothetical protein